MRHLLALSLCCFANLATAQTDWTTPGGGDPDSFRRSLTYLGQTSTPFVYFDQACDPEAFPAPQLCVQVPTITDFSPPVGFEFDNLASIVIPGGSTHSTIWPLMTTKFDVTFVDPAANGAVHATLMVNVIITMESSVLNDPTIIDPSTRLCQCDVRHLPS